jgi:LuxR family maltose regulon positive regulatory protein
MACGRARLLSGQGDFAGAEEVAGRLSAVASERGLLRAELRGLALSMAAAARAGEADRAQARLVEFLGRAREAGYLRPLVREREVAEVALRRLLDDRPDALTRDAAESALAQVTLRRPTFSQRELQVLAEVREGLRNREIAVRLGISQPGVRFHLANIYRKTGVNRREEAVRSAQSLGVLD